jgi:hypothetical protein
LTSAPRPAVRGACGAFRTFRPNRRSAIARGGVSCLWLPGNASIIWRYLPLLAGWQSHSYSEVTRPRESSPECSPGLPSRANKGPASTRNMPPLLVLDTALCPDLDRIAGPANAIRKRQPVIDIAVLPGHTRRLSDAKAQPASGFTFLQISDSHIGFKQLANPNALATLEEAIGKAAALPQNAPGRGRPKRSSGRKRGRCAATECKVERPHATPPLSASGAAALTVPGT